MVKMEKITSPKKFTKRLISGITAFVMTFSAVVQTGICSKTVKAADENAAKRVYGDLNEDGTINIFDLMHLKNILLKSEKDNKMLKFADVDGDGETSFKDISEMVRYLMSEIGIFKPELELDSDKDGLCDYFEQILGTDLQNPDSDDDGLSDFEEVFISFTDPLKEDTDGTGKKDGLKDFDDDGLCNADEIKNNTDLFRDDTDLDGVKDAEEVEKGTKSDSFDSDDDGISDLGELKLGLDPVLSSTDGKTPDSKRYFDQTMSEEKLAEVNDNNRLYTLSVSAHMAGYLDDIMNVKVSPASNALSNRATYGTIIDVDFEDTVCDTAEMEYTMSFHLDTEDNPEDYMVFYYSEEDYLLVPFETSYDGKDISMTYSQKGTFCLVNINALDFSTEDVLDLGEIETEDENNEETKNIDDESSSEFVNGIIGNNDMVYGVTANDSLNEVSYAFYFSLNTFQIKCWDDRLLYLMTESAKKLSANGKKIKAYVVFTGKYFGYNYSVTFSCEKADDFKDVYNMAKVFFSKHITDPFEAEREYNDITSDSEKYPILKNGVPPVRMGTIFKDALPVMFGFGNITSNYDLFLNGANWCVLGSDYLADIPDKKFQYYSKNKSSIEIIYDIILNNYSSKMHYRRSSYFGFIPVSKSITDKSLADYITSKGSKKSSVICTDNMDFFDHIATNLIRVENGKVYYPTYGSVSNKQIQTKKGMEILTTKKQIDLESFLSTSYFPLKIEMDSADKDQDGIPNELDPNPQEAFDSRFELVDKYDADPYELFPDYVLHGDSEDDSDGYDQTYLEWYNSLYQTAKRENDKEEMKQIENKYMGTEAAHQFLKILGLVFGNVSGANLGRFLDETFEKDEVVDIGSDAIEQAIEYSKGGRFGFYNCMNAFFQCAEDTVFVGNTLSLSSRTDKAHLLPGTEIWNASSGSAFKDYVINSPKSDKEFDILFGISSYHNAIVAKNIMCIEKNNKTYYKAKVRFYLLDFYDYNGIDYIGELQRNGLAEPYLYSSCKEMDVEWEKGMRLPEYDSYTKVNLEYEYSLFSGIDGL